MASPRYKPGDLVEVQLAPGVSWQSGEVLKNAAEAGWIGRLWWVVAVGTFKERHTIPQRRMRARTKGGG